MHLAGSDRQTENLEMVRTKRRKAGRCREGFAKPQRGALFEKEYLSSHRLTWSTDIERNVFLLERGFVHKPHGWWFGTPFTVHLPRVFLSFPSSPACSFCWPRDLKRVQNDWLSFGVHFNRACFRGLVA